LAQGVQYHGMDTPNINPNSNPFRDTRAQDQQRAVIPHQRSKRYLLIAAFVISAIASAWLLAPWLRAGAGVSSNTLRFAEVSAGVFVADTSGYAQVVAARAPMLYAVAEGSVRYQVEPGQSVQQGDVLALIDSPALQANLAQEQSAMDAAVAEADRQRVANQRALLEKQRSRDQAVIAETAALREQQRAERAYALQAISEVDFLRAKDALAAARITVQHANRDMSLEQQSLALELNNRISLVARQRSIVEALQTQVAALSIRAPFAGVVGNRAAAERAQLGKDAAVISVVDLGEFELDLSVGEIYSPLLRTGLQANIERDGKNYAGIVRSVSPEVINGQISLRVRFQDGKPKDLKQNQRLLTRIEFERRERALSMPRGAYLDELNGKSIWLRRERVLQRVPIEIGAIGAERVEVLNGLKAGDVVVVSSVEAKPEQSQLYLH
jgi:HlyD family secretion protein